jgi:Protein of unknown function (DUF4199)
VAAWLVVNYTLIPDFADAYAAYLVQDQRARGASEPEIGAVVAQGEQMKEMLANPLINAAVTFTEPFPVGLLVTLISAAVLKKKPEAA